MLFPASSIRYSSDPNNNPSWYNPLAGKIIIPVAGTYSINYSTSYYLDTTPTVDLYNINMLIWLNNSKLISSADTSGAITDPTYQKLVCGSGSHVSLF